MSAFGGVIKNEKQLKIAEEIVNIQLNQKITLEQSVTRNIMFVGRSRCGKSTIFEVLKNPGFVAKTPNIFRQTTKPKLHSFTVSKYYKSETDRNDAMEVLIENKNKASSNEAQLFDEKEEEYEAYRLRISRAIEEEKKQRKLLEKNDKNFSISFNINIIDTPGLFEDTQVGQFSADNDSIKSTILTCMRKEIKKIHAIFFVISFSVGVNKEDILAFKEFLKLFQGAEANIGLIITKCEKTSEVQKKSLKDQIYKSEELHEILSKIDGNRIFFMGCVSSEAYHKGLVDSVKLSLKNVKAMRTDLFNFIFSLTEPCKINQIGFIKNKGKLVLKDQKKLLALLKQKDIEKGTGPKAGEILALARKIDSLEGFIRSEEGIKLKEETLQLFIDLDKKLLKKQGNFALLLEKSNDKELVKKTYQQIKEDKPLIRSRGGVALFKRNTELYNKAFRN